MPMAAATVVVLALWTLGFGALCVQSYANCDRDCSANGSPKECVYDMEIAYYYTMAKACFLCPFVLSDCFRPQCITADGFKRAIIVVNRMLPGPQIRVCENDTIVVNVKNQLSAGDATTMHWHGMHQVGTPYMDGVPMLTQCPIVEMTSFQYRFRAYPEGTHFWHSHVGFQRGDGAAGALVVKSAKDVHKNLYDYDLPEHTVIVQDFPHNLTVDKFTGHLNAGYNNKAQSIIINGKGNFQPYVYNSTGSTFFTPKAVFNVTSGKRYRFRFIANTVLNCPIEISIDNHTLLVIASDGSPFEPVTADVITMSGGERYDFILSADQAPQSYWLYARGLADCSQYPAQQVAVLLYNNSQSLEPADPPRPWTQPRTGIMVNPFNEGIPPQTSSSAFTVANLTSKVPLEDWVSKTANKRFYLSMDMYAINNPYYNDPVLYPISATKPLGTSSSLPQVNRVTNMLQSSPALTQYESLNQDLICDYTETNRSIARCSQEFCQCMQVLKVKVRDIVELVLIDEGVPFNISSHAFHLHGQQFRVMNMWQNPARATSREAVMEMDSKTTTRFVASTKPVLKDTITLPDGGYAIVKFRADNPGVWFLHCHNEFHALAGMSLTIQVGDPKQWPTPPSGFPRCGSWRPPTSYARPPTIKPTWRGG